MSLESGQGAGRWGGSATPSLRITAVIAWVSLLARLIAASLPGSHTGIETWIRRADTVSSVLSQGVALIGSSLLVLLVVETLSDRTLSPVYRVLVTIPSAVVLFLVMFSIRMPLEPAASLALGVTCLVLAGAGAALSLRPKVTRGHGIVLLAIGLSAMLRLSIRALDAEPHLEAAMRQRLPVLAATARAIDLGAVSFAAARFIAERRTAGIFLVLVGLVVATILAWGGLRGSFDGASMWQVLAARALGDLAGGSGAAPTPAGYTVDAFALFLAGIVALWPGTVSLGLSSIAFALLGRPGADVPTGALLIALSGLIAPLCAGAKPAGPHPVRAISVSHLVLLVTTTLMVITGCHHREKSVVEHGQGVFLRSCAGCHGPDARGSHPPGFSTPPRDLTDPALQARLSDADLRETIRRGKGQMPPFGAALPEEDVASLIAYLRRLR